MKISTLFLILLAVASSGKDRIPTQTCVAVAETSNSITVRCLGYGKQQTDAINSAETIGIKSLLFRGVPGTKISKPIIGTDESSIINEFSSYFEELFTNFRYKSFIISSSQIGDFQKNKQYKMWSITTEITINVTMLKKDLETQGIIRKFGY